MYIFWNICETMSEQEDIAKMYGDTWLGVILENEVSQFETRRTYDWRNKLRRIPKKKGVLYDHQRIPIDPELKRNWFLSHIDLWIMDSQQ